MSQPGTFIHPSVPRLDEEPLLSIEDLKTYFHTDEGRVKAVDGVTLAVEQGKTLGIVGESGSGKSVTALSVLRLIPEQQGQIVGGHITWRGGEDPINLAALPIEEMPRFRGSEISMIFQEPMTSLNPVFKCGWQIAEAITQHTNVGWKAARKRAVELLAEVGIDKPEKRMDQYPHELSGGMKQRVMIAMALACDPKLLVCDEPTTALDVTIQQQILDLIGRLQRERNMAVLFITHDLGVVAEITDFVVVMCPGETLRMLHGATEGEGGSDFDRGGHIVEFGSVSDIFTNPQHPYTKGLIACRPTLKTRSKRLPTINDFIRAESKGFTLDPTDPALEIDYPGRATNSREDMPGFGEPLIEVKGLRTWFPIQAGIWQRVVDWDRAVDGVDLTIPRGKTVGLVGESGCGKTTLGRSILQLVRPREGEVSFEGRDLTQLSRAELRPLRRRLQIIFQDPYSSLNPRLTVEDALVEPMALHGLYENTQGRRDRAVWLMERVGLKADHLYRYPHEFSGGQRQRICIARTLASEPEFIVCDESVSALDVSIQAEVINLLLDLQDDMGLTYLFITHDLSVVKYVSDFVVVMSSSRVLADLYEGEERERVIEEARGGHIVEMKAPDELYRNPEHPYTRKLLSAIPAGDPSQVRRRRVAEQPAAGG